MTSTAFYACDHPPLLTKDNLCHLCEQLDGQEDALTLLEER